MPSRHLVTGGECMASIASRYGFRDYRALYDHPDNAELKRKRPNPNVLAPGDVVAIPDLAVEKSESLAVDRAHRVRVVRPKKELRILFEDARGEPLASVPYLFEVEGAEPKSGNTDGSGMLKERVPIGATRATVTFAGRTLRLRLHDLRPLSETDDEGARGMRDRLKNLGYHLGAERPRPAIAALRAAVPLVASAIHAATEAIEDAGEKIAGGARALGGVAELGSKSGLLPDPIEDIAEKIGLAARTTARAAETASKLADAAGDAVQAASAAADRAADAAANAANRAMDTVSRPKLDRNTRTAIALFQKDFEHPIAADLDDALRDQLATEHGS